ncbi:hypothetical protein [Corynebacterium glyciniphilum]|nr:hypothetical protein [Corynebacterium glyciniphilum]
MTDSPGADRGSFRDDARWARSDGSGWIPLGRFGEINPVSDNEGDAGRFFFYAKTPNGEYARAKGPEVTGGDECWQYEVDQPFHLKDTSGNCIEVIISRLIGGRYSVQYRDSVWPTDEGSGAW